MRFEDTFTRTQQAGMKLWPTRRNWMHMIGTTDIIKWIEELVNKKTPHQRES